MPYHINKGEGPRLVNDPAGSALVSLKLGVPSYVFLVFRMQVWLIEPIFFVGAYLVPPRLIKDFDIPIW